MSKYLISFFENISKKPLVGLGVVGTKTLTNSDLVFFDISPSLSFVAKPTAQIPFLGYSTNTTLFFVILFEELNVSVNCPIAEYIVLRIGIRFNKSLKICKIFFQ